MTKLLLFTMLSLSTISITYGSSESKACYQLLAPFLKKDSPSSKPQPHHRLTLNQSDTFNRKLYKKAVDAKLNSGQMEHFIDGINRFGNDPVVLDKIDSYLQFVKSLPVKRREAALLVISEISSSNSQSKFIKKFHKILKDLNKFEEKELKRIQKELGSNGDAKLERLAKSKALGRKLQYEKIAFGCRSGGWTPARKNGAKQFKRFILGVGAASTLAAYSYNHRDEEINNEWFGKLGYELTMSVVTGWLTSKIISNPASSAVKKGVLTYLVGRPISWADTRVYAHLFGTSVEEAEAKLQEILKKPEYREEIKQLIAFLEEKRIYQRYKESIISYASSIVSSPNSSGDKPAISSTSIDWNNLSKKDLEDERNNDILIAAVMAGAYEGQTGEWIKSGDKGFDRFSFYTGYSLLTLAPTIYVNLLIYRILCMGALDPTRAMMMGVGVYALNRVVFDQVQYFFRKKAINQ